MGEKNRRIYVLLTRMPDWGSRALSLCTLAYYTHASLGLDEDLNTFYSVCLKGFRVEDISRYNRSEKGPFPCALYEIPVFDKTYYRVRKTLDSISCGKKPPRYSHLGVALGVLGVEHRFSGKRFCSQFVSEILERCGVVKLQKDSSLYMPNDFQRLPGLHLVFRGYLNHLHT